LIFSLKFSLRFTLKITIKRRKPGITIKMKNVVMMEKICKNLLVNNGKPSRINGSRMIPTVSKIKMIELLERKKKFVTVTF